MQSCHDSIAATKRAARENLDSLVVGPWYTDNELAGDVAHARFHIKLLQAIDDVEAAELRSLSHSCIACNCHPGAAAHNTCATTLATALMNEVRDKLKKMEVVAARIKDRSDTVQKLEQHLKTYDNICKSLDIVLPGDGTKYSYRIDLNKGVSLVIQPPDEYACKKETRPSTPNLIDMNPFPDNNTTPVLEPASASSSTLVSPVSAPGVYSPLTITPSHHFAANSDPAPNTTPNITPMDILLSIPRPQTTPQTNPNPPISQIRDIEEERLRSPPSHFRVQGVFDPNTTPLFFRHGIQYHPPSSNGNEDEDGTAHSRMVIFTNLDPATTSHDILSRVRGGPVLRVVGASESAALVTFVHAADAAAYASYVSSHSRKSPLSIRGREVAVSLAPTASYPPRTELLLDIALHGVTRCLAFPRYDARVAAFVAQRRACGFVEDRRVVAADLLRDCAAPSVTAGGTGIGEGEGTEEWVGMDAEVEVDDDKRFVHAAMMENGSLVLVSFRDVVFAQTAFETLWRCFPLCGVQYAPDRCAGPLSELEGTG